MEHLFYLLGTLLAYAIVFIPGILIVKVFGRTVGVIFALLGLAGFFVFVSQAKAETYYSFKFKTKDELKISVPAASYEEAYKKAYRECFQRLTKGEYPGEEAGLNIIDICANGKMK